MIARVAITLDSLRELVAQRDERVKAFQFRDLAETMRDRGVLVVCTEADKRSFYNFVRIELSDQNAGLPAQVLEKMLEFLVKHCRFVVSPSAPRIALDAVVDPRTFKVDGDWFGRVDVAVVDDSQATSLGLKPDRCSVNIPTLAGGLLAGAGATTAITTAKTVRRSQPFDSWGPAGVFAPESTREEAFLRIQTAALFSKKIVVTDRYLFRDASSRTGESIDWFVRRVSKLPPIAGGRELVFLGTFSQQKKEGRWMITNLPRGFQEVMDRLLKLSNHWDITRESGVSAVRFSAIDYSKAGKVHDRYIHFSAGFGLGVGTGFGPVFDQESLSKDAEWKVILQSSEEAYGAMERMENAMGVKDTTSLIGG